MKILIISWKNIWRNKLRSSILIGAIAIGILCGTFFIAIMLGMVNQRTKDAIHNEVGHIQIHNPKLKGNDEVQYTIHNYQKIIAEIYTMKEVKQVVDHTKSMIQLSSASSGSGAIIIGITPEQEKKISLIPETIWDSTGTYFEENIRKPILISKKTALDLKLENYKFDSVTLKKIQAIIPDTSFYKIDTLGLFRNKLEIMLFLKSKLTENELETYKQDICNSSVIFNPGKKISFSIVSKNIAITNGIFRIAGIYKTSNGMFDGTTAFTLNSDLRNLLELNSDETHEIEIMLHNENDVEKVTTRLQSKYPHLQVESWKIIKPDAGMLADMMGMYSIVFMTIILAALGFGIINTMLMVVLERIKEIGMLMAIGMNKFRVFLMIVFETIMLCLVGAFLGMIGGYYLIHITSSGINISFLTKGMESIGYAAVLYPELDFLFFIQVTGLTILIGILAAIYPAMKAINLNPAEAVRTDV